MADLRTQEGRSLLSGGVRLRLLLSLPALGLLVSAALVAARDPQTPAPRATAAAPAAPARPEPQPSLPAARSEAASCGGCSCLPAGGCSGPGIPCSSAHRTGPGGAGAPTAFYG